MSDERKCECPVPGVGKEYRCDDKQGTPFPSHCHCGCHKHKAVMFSKETGGAYADMNEVIESELQRLRREDDGKSRR